MENELLGVGCGANTKLAGQVGAMNPMGDIDVIEKYIFAKERFERRRIELRARIGPLRLRIRVSKYYREIVKKRAKTATDPYEDVAKPVKLLIITK